jgi:hypothetical protein
LRVPTPLSISDCFWHGLEDCTVAYTICFECDHVYPTEGSLRREHRKLAWEIGFKFWVKSFLMPTEDIWSCPLCTHDW